MKEKLNKSIAQKAGSVRVKFYTSVVYVVTLCFLSASLPAPAVSNAFAAGQNTQAGATAAQPASVLAFERNVREYVKLRERLEEKLPKLDKDSTPEQIQAHKAAFIEAVRSARVGATRGNLFTPDIAAYIRATIKNTFKGKQRRELRETVLEADTKGVPVRVNYTYPESKELTQIPPTLLLKLPQLPKQMRYRFVGQHMLLVDRENGLIVDYMLNALP